jgi:hypothetical protein
MFALRRSLSKLAVRSIQPAFKPTMMVMPAVTCMRPFSFDVISSGANKLDKALSKEIKYENENYQQLEDIETFLQESGFAFAETDAGVAMTLTKTIGDKTIEIAFDAR